MSKFKNAVLNIFNGDRDTVSPFDESNIAVGKQSRLSRVGTALGIIEDPKKKQLTG